MARLARVVIPGVPHHVTQRGNRRGQTFFEDADYALYRDLLGEAAAKAGAEVWAYCLMPNHVHVILTPSDEDGLRRTFADLHRRYTGAINARHRWTGHLWQGRFGSVAMDDAYLAAAARYVAMNPVRARLVERPEDWRWSSVAAHLEGKEDAAAYAALRQSETTGRPLGAAAWIEAIEQQTGRTLAPQKRGPKPRVISKLSP
jgi:putative transposase